VSAPSGAARQAPASENCRFCWMCRHVCPVGHVTSRETLTPHAWALTIESVRRGQLAWNDETAAVMFACADCGLCRAHCVTDQPLPDAIVSAREEIVRAGAAPAAVRDLASRLAAREAAADPGAPGHRPALGGRALFVGEVVTDHADAAEAAMRLLSAAGLAVTAFGRGQPTGLVPGSLGLAAAAAALARRVTGAVTATGAAEILVLSPADKWTFEYVYSHRLGVEWPRDVCVTEVSTALAGALDEERLSFDRRAGVTVAYHDPCHAARARRNHHDPRRLLRAAGHEDIRELFWRGDRAHPCGAIGGLDLTHPSLARDLAMARVHDALGAGASVLVTDDPVCQAHLERHAAGAVQVRGLYDLLAERLQ
jgi:Fe-S oxidoreductase